MLLAPHLGHHQAPGGRRPAPPAAAPGPPPGRVPESAPVPAPRYAREWPRLSPEANRATRALHPIGIATSAERAGVRRRLDALRGA